MTKEKVTAEERIEGAKACAEGRMSQAEAARRFGVDKTTIRRWLARYQAGGSLAFKTQEHNQVYRADLKRKAVEEYLAGKGSQEKISAKYGLRSSCQLRDRIKVYNSGRDFGRKMSGRSRMKQGRETTQEERITIVRECLENGSNYGETAIKYNVSYQQVYTWVKKYKKLGEAGLEDRRGKRIAEQTPRTELEEARIEIERLKRKLYLAEVERDLLKKQGYHTEICCSILHVSRSAYYRMTIGLFPILFAAVTIIHWSMILLTQLWQAIRMHIRCSTAIEVFNIQTMYSTQSWKKPV